MGGNFQPSSKETDYQERKQKKLAELQKYQQKQLLKKLSLWILVFLVGAALIFGLVKFLSSQQGQLAPTSVSEVKSSDRTKGAQNPKVVLIEYSDFQCPACGYYYPLVKQLTGQFSNDLQFVYRHFPLPVHNHAKLAAAAAEAAGLQGKFWEMHDLIFENQNVWSAKQNAKDSFTQYAANLNLDLGKFKTSLESKEVKDKVDSDALSGRRAGVNSTPTFFLNGVKLTNPKNYAEFAKIIATEIARP